jgi:hypothetical protein
MCHAHPVSSSATDCGACEDGSPYRQFRITVARSLLKKTCLPFIAILAGLVFAMPGNVAHADNRTIILNYICTTYESARQVALVRGWENPANMPGDCRTLFQRAFELRIAEIQQIMEIIPIEDGRWIEIGRVHRRYVQSGYSAGVAEQLFLF